MSRFFDLAGSLFGHAGVSDKYREHGVGMGYPVEGYHDRPADQRVPFMLGKGQKLKGKLTVQVRQFDLSKPEDLKEYAETRDRIANKLWIQIDRRVWTNPQTGEMKVHMEWAMPEYIRPKGDEPDPPAEYNPKPPAGGESAW